MGAFKLGKMTLGSLFKKPATVRYPFEKKQAPVGLKGQIGIVPDQCILCGMCERSCTTNCLSVDKQAREWGINRYQCVQCGYCITVCPKSCLYMLPAYAAAAPQMVKEIFAIPQSDKASAKTDKKDSLSQKDAATLKDAAAQASAVKKEQNEARELPTKDQVEAVENLDGTWTQDDAQLQSLLGLMDSDRAEKARRELGV